MADKITLKDLKALIKEHAKTLPKMSSGKMNLMLYADKNGLIKKKEEPVKNDVLPANLKKPVKTVAVKEELPEVLKAPKAKDERVLSEVLKGKQPVKSKKVEEIKPVKKVSPFAQFMSEHKGQGYSMTQMSQMYKESKSE